MYTMLVYQNVIVQKENNFHNIIQFSNES